MKKLQISLIGAVVVAGVIVTLAMRSRTRAELRQKEAAEQQQDQQLATLTADHQRLSNLVAQAASAPAAEPAAELERLSSQAKGLRAENEKLGKQVEDKRRVRPSQPARFRAPHAPEYYQELWRRSAGKATDAKVLGIAFATYANEHDGRFPATMDEATAYCGKGDLTGTNQFEILFKGSTRDLKVPRSEVIVARDRQTFQAPSGKSARIYITADGAAQVIESDDNFQAYEAAHLINR